MDLKIFILMRRAKTLINRMFTFFLDLSKDLLIPQSTGKYKHILKICHEHNTNIYTEYIYIYIYIEESLET